MDDGNACLVVAELKRGPTPKEVIAQVVNYAAYVSQLKWPDVAEIGRKYRGIDLDAAYRDCFGWSLVKPDKVDHRLLILAESYDPRVTDAAVYLINQGTPLTLLGFKGNRIRKEGSGRHASESLEYDLVSL